MKHVLSAIAKEHVSLAKSDSNKTRRDEVLVDGNAREKWNMPKRACVLRIHYENKFESVDNNKNRTRFEVFTEDEETEVKIVDSVDDTY